MTDTRSPVDLDDILRIVTAPDDATIVAVHDRAALSLDIVCTVCGSPYTLLLGRGCTEDVKNRHRASFADAADKHAATRHTPRTATDGSQP